MLLKTKFRKLKWLTCDTHGVHWYVSSFYVLLGHNKITILHLKRFRRTQNHMPKHLQKPPRRVIITRLCFRIPMFFRIPKPE